MTKSIIERIQPAVRNISPYTLHEYEYEVKINQNENPYDVPADIKQDILDYALDRSWSRYPPFVPTRLHELLADYADWSPDGIITGNGSNEIIQAVMAVLLPEGGRLVLPTPTFTVYKLIATIMGGIVDHVPLTPDYQFDCDAVERAARNADMVIICSPNNPTGALYSPDRLERLLEMTDAAVIVDEAYYEFSRETVIPLIRRYDNLIVFRTFSKAFSLAGLRFGYGVMAPVLAAEVKKAALPYNLNFITTAAAEKLLENRDRLAVYIDELIKSRDKLFKDLQFIEGVTVYPSRSNFLLFETPYTPKDVFDGLLEDGLLVRDVSSYPMLEQALRVSVSTPKDNARFVTALTRVMNDLSQRR